MACRKLRQAGVVVITLLLLSSAVAIPVAAAIPADGSTSAAVSGEQFVDATSNVEVWQRAMFPFRVSPNNARTQIENADEYVRVTSFGASAPTNRERLAVHGADQTLRLTFQGSFVQTGRFSGQEMQLLAAKVDDEATAQELFSGSTAMTASEAMSLLGAENANENASFELVDAGTADSEGELTATYDLSKAGPARGAGMYMFFLVQDRTNDDSWGAVTDSGFETTGGDLSVDGKARVVGVDAAVVQGAAAGVAPEQKQYTAGDTVTFDVDANLEGDDVNHSLVVYDAKRFQNKEVETVIDGELSRNLTTDRITVNRQIRNVNGVANVGDDVSLFGIDLGDGRVSPIGGVSVVDFVAEQLRADTPIGGTIDPTTELDGSMRAVKTSASTTLEVETFENWSSGTYRYVYVATGDDTSELSTKTGQITIQKAVKKAEPVRNGRSIVNFPEEAAVSKADIAISETEGTVSVEQRVTPPRGTPSVGKPTVAYLDITVPESARNDRGTLTFTVNRNKLGELSPSNISTYHYTSGEWEELETTYELDGNTVTLTAETDGFSPFSIAESTAPNQERDSDDEDDADENDGGSGNSIGEHHPGTLTSVTTSLASGRPTTVTLAGSGHVDSVALQFDQATSGRVQVTELRAVPSAAAFPSGRTVVSTLDVTVPNDVENTSATLSLTVAQSRLDDVGVDADDLVVYRYNDETQEWEMLETSVTTTDETSVTLDVETPGFSYFVVGTQPQPVDEAVTTTAADEPDEQATDETTETTDETTESSASSETTETTSPGFGAVVAIVALVAAALLVRRRD